MVVRPLTPALAEKARVDFGENPDLLEAKLQEIKDWIATQPHLRARTDDQWLVAFLRGCKFKLDLVKTKIDLYYSLRSTTPEIYTLKYNDLKVKQVLDLGSAIVLQKLKDPAAPRPYIIRLGSYNPKEWTIFDVMAAATFQLQEALPIRVKETHIIGSSYVFETIMNIAIRFMSNKINRRILVHSNLESLYKHLPREILPVELGGTGSELQENIDCWKRKFDDYRDFFEEDLGYAIDEALRGKEKKNRIQDIDQFI